jgi:2-polyprenyl-6-methoxyphenol hydroxylase-like FAD-dependent oxidoreductase
MSGKVIIAGGGPTGLMLACELGLLGVETVVLEKRAEPSGESRGMGFHARSVELLNQRGLRDRLYRDNPLVWPKVHFALFWLDMSTVDEDEYTLVMPQWRVEQILEERAGELGVDVRRGHEVAALSQDDNQVTVGVRAPTGNYELAADYVVGADGGGSAVRRLAGIGFEDFGGLKYYGVLADVRIDGPRERFAPSLHPTGMYVEVLGQDDMLRIMSVEFDVEAPDRSTPVTLSELKGSARRVAGKDLDLPEPQWMSRFSSGFRMAERFRAGRVLLAGDAAHIHFPAGGQGLNTGIQDAVNLGWKLAAELGGWAPPGLLDSYHTERYPVGAKVLANSQAQLALMYPVPKVNPLREVFAELTRLPEVNRYLVEMVAGLAVTYPMPDVPDHPLLGRRAPNVTLSTVDGEVTVAELLRDGNGVLLDLSGDAAELPDCDGWAGRLRVVQAEPHDRLAAPVLLIRPDGHVALADRDPSALRRALDTWFGAPAAATVGVR